VATTLCVDGNERLIFFRKTPYEAARGMEKYVQDVPGLGKYNWVEAVWQVLVESLDEMQQKGRCV